jgi:two-component system nitrate/nitrite response regulator NarL
MVHISPNTRILTITDDRLFYLRVHYALAHEYGTEIMLTSNTTLKGLKRIEQLEPDIILVDGDMPDNDALSVCSYILQNGYSGNIILFEMDFERARRACKIGVTTCFPKDIGYRELLSSITLIRQREQVFNNAYRNHYPTNCKGKKSITNLNALGNIYFDHIVPNIQKKTD